GRLPRRQGGLRSAHAAQSDQGNSDAAALRRVRPHARQARRAQVRRSAALLRRDMEKQLDLFRERILDASAQGQALCIRGGGSKDWYGREPVGDVLDTRGCSGIVSYDPTELVITVCSGTPLTEVEAVLAQRNQTLAFEPPHFGAGATVGGMVAAGLAGPRRAAVGAV